jgi:hypothetical protein
MNTHRIFVIKLIHSVIYFFMVACLIYIFYCGIVGRYDWTLLAALIAIFLEGAALLLNHGECPLTTLARQSGDPNGSVTDIFLPMWCARQTFRVSIVVVAIELVLLSVGYFGQ